MNETIEAAAIMYEGVLYTVPRPARHHDCLPLIWSSLGDKPGEERCIRGETQGFVTSAGRFVRREPALRMAIKAGQTKAGKFNNRQLFSEDLW